MMYKFSRKLMLLLLGSMIVSVSGFARPAYPAEAFAFMVKTDNVGSSTKLQFVIPTRADIYTYNYNVDCEGDGTYEHTGINGNFTCNYASMGTYTIAIGGTFPAIYFNDEGDKEKIIYIRQWGTQEWKSMGGAFSGASNLVVEAYNDPDLSDVSDMSYMFYNATALTFTHPIDDWDVSNVHSAAGMFYGAEAFNSDIGNWRFSSGLRSLAGMFLNATSFNQDIGEWDVSGVIDMTNMFWGATAFNQDIGEWDVSHVTHMSNMFKNVHLSLSNYDNLLLSWSKLTVQNDVSFSAGNSNYILQGEAKDILVNTFNWTIIDGDIDINRNIYITSPNTMSVKDGEQAIGIVTSSYGVDDTWYDIIDDVADGNRFSINDDGELRFITPPDASNPNDKNSDNIYRVQVSAYDDMGMSVDYQTIRVKVRSNGAIVPVISYLLF